jgi:CHAD domain-containing protein
MPIIVLLLLFFAERAASQLPPAPPQSVGMSAPALEHLQDALGDLNDIVVHEQLIATMGVRHRRSSRKRAFAAGLLTGREDARLDTAMAAAVQAYAELAKVKPFWA